MKKKIMLTATAAALATMMIVGGTIAWFTDEAEVTNVITMGNVDIELYETLTPATEENEAVLTTEGLEFGEEVPITPGAELPKDPFVVNIGKNDAWVRILVELEGTILDVEGFNFNELVTIDPNWKLGEDGYYYYNAILAKDAQTTPLFNMVTIPGDWGNEFVNQELDIQITAEAIQADNIDVGEATGADAAIAAFEGKTIEPLETPAAE